MTAGAVFFRSGFATVSPLGPSFFPATRSLSAHNASHKSRRFMRLPPLELSCLSFFNSCPLFSTACSLFAKIPGGGGTSAPTPRSAPAPIRSGRLSALSLPLVLASFLFIHLQIPLLQNAPLSIFNLPPFSELQSPLPVTRLFSHLYATPVCHPSRFQFCNPSE